MLIEILFSILFFVLPIVGMFITILITKLEKEKTEVQRHTKAWYRTHVITKIEKKDCNVPKSWIVDTS